MPTSNGRRWTCHQWSDPEYRTRIIPTMYIFLGYAAMGFVFSQRGATFLDIQLITHTTLETASYFFTVSAVGRAAGGLLFGGLYDKLNKSLVIYVVVLGGAVSVVVIPYCTIYGLMALSWFVNYFFFGGFGVCASAEVVRLWGLKSQPYLFFVNLGFSLGALLAPIVTEPFLVPKDIADNFVNFLHKPLCSNLTDNVTLIRNLSNELVSLPTPHNVTGSGFENLRCLNITKRPEIDIQLHYAYLISAIFTFLISFPFLYLFCHSKSHNVVRTKDSEYKDVHKLPIRHFVLSITVIILTFMCMSGIEDAMSSFLMTYLVKQLNWTKSAGTRLLSLFFGMFAVCRIFGIFCGSNFRSTLILFSSLFIIILSTTGTVLCSIYSVNIGIWILVSISGIMISTLFPVGIVWTNNTLVSVTGRVSSALLFGSSSGKLLTPIILGYFMEEYSPLWFCYIIIIETAICIIIMILSTIYGQKVLSPIRQHQKELEVTMEERFSISTDEETSDERV